MPFANPTDQFRGAFDRIQMINNILAVLSMAIKTEEVYSITLSALIAKQGLDFMRSFIFIYNSKKDCFEGKYAMGPTTQKDAIQFIEEQNKEDQYFAEILKELETEEDFATSSDILSRLYNTLRSNVVWISSFQKYGLDNELTNQISPYCFPLNLKDTPNNLISILFEKNRAIKLNRRTNPDVLPESFLEILDDTFATVLVKTKKGAQSILIVDRKFSNREITLSDLRALDWFVNQSSLAIENAELFNDLENAYNELKEVENLKSNFLSTISHELRTPLTSIAGFIELVLKEKLGPITEQQKELLSRVSINAHHLIQMVNDLIQLAELGAEGITEIRLFQVDPLETLMGILPKFEHRRRTKSIEIEPVIQESPPKILSDKKSLEQIFYHIIDNAVKFSPENGKVLIKFFKEYDKLIISIEDQGIGIPQEKLQKIFESFYQVDSNLNRTYEGLGVGLAITRLLLSATNGQIEVQSKVGEGSKFNLKYPISE